MLLRKDLSKTQETLKSFFCVFSKSFSWFCICLNIRGLVVFGFSSLVPKSLFLLFWQMKTMERRWRKYDSFLSSEQWAMSCELWTTNENVWKTWLWVMCHIKTYVLLYNKRRHYRVDGHPELVSGSVRGEGQEKARGEMLKQVNFVQFAHARHSTSKLGSALA